MTKSIFFLGALGLLSLQGYSQSKAKPKPAAATAKAAVLKTRIDSISYGIGLNIADNLKTQGLENVNTAVLSKAIQDVLKKSPLLLTKEQSDMSISNYLQQLKAEKFAKNREAGVKFLAENKSKPGVVALPSGLQYQVLRAGDGPKPTATDKVRTHYHGTLIDGTVFDSSVDRGEPISFPVNGVIKGWTEALQLMPVGSKWRLFIPADLAYGDRQAGPKIAPGSTLIFDVELLAIEK
ncbi:FKBP-type peptidyl-prolyl cis-trans isomerase [Chitinophaga vietnamensis]|uniref:FKBP-type peptidyl-prolyl cis-trans isomerase n=1 Tax=Chitinophaga vietnamensis TaxID=2593957 RepID=UPI0011785B68|nr:FKBP-type peptidyl-prolyl cis-trans isomerase [Chitinophaga vietnamensis]